MAIGQLDFYNGALLYLKEKRLANLSENREARYLLDQLWNEGAGNGSQVINACLAEGEWLFAKRTVQIDYGSNIQPAFGFYYACEIPSDYVRLINISADEAFTDPLNQYNEEGGYFFTPYQTIWLKYVSNDASYGGNYNRWHPIFYEYVKAYMAHKICGKVTGSKTTPEEMRKEKDRLMYDALGKDAIERPAQFPSRGTWVKARFGRRGFRDTDRTR